MQKSILAILAVLCLLSVSSLALQDEPKKPVWANYWEQEFVQGNGGNSTFRTVGGYWYDFERKTTRVDRRNGMNDPFCGPIQPNVSTHCTMLTRDGKRYIFFPEKRLCCVCCDAAHGCDVLKPNWLEGSTYQGREDLSGQSFDKWKIPDGDVFDYYWASPDEKQILRKIDQGQTRIKDFIMATYHERKAVDAVFALPEYCDSTKWCPKTSKCGKFQD